VSQISKDAWNVTASPQLRRLYVHGSPSFNKLHPPNNEQQSGSPRTKKWRWVNGRKHRPVNEASFQLYSRSFPAAGTISSSSSDTIESGAGSAATDTAAAAGIEKAAGADCIGAAGIGDDAIAYSWVFGVFLVLRKCFLQSAVFFSCLSKTSSFANRFTAHCTVKQSIWLPVTSHFTAHRDCQLIYSSQQTTFKLSNRVNIPSVGLWNLWNRWISQSHGQIKIDLIFHLFKHQNVHDFTQNTGQAFHSRKTVVQPLANRTVLVSCHNKRL